MKTTFGRTTMTTSQELDRAQERADKASAELRRTQAELRVTQVWSKHCHICLRIETAIYTYIDMHIRYPNASLVSLYTYYLMYMIYVYIMYKSNSDFAIASAVLIQLSIYLCVCIYNI